jgi:hypothetical protein
MKSVTKDVLNNKNLLGISLVIIITIFLIVSKMVGDSKEKQNTETGTYTTSGVKPSPGINTWEGVTPGLTTYNEAKGNLGEYIERRPSRDLHIYTHKDLDTGMRKYEVGVDNKGIVKYIRVPITYSEARTLPTYKDLLKLGDPDIVKFEKDGSGEEAYVFLKEGIILSVYANPMFVYFETYFEPMSYNDFYAFWGHRLADEYYPHQDYPGGF